MNESNAPQHSIRAFRSEPVRPPRDAKAWGIPQEWVKPGQPLEVEIGCGVGLHALARVREKKEVRLVAIERTAEKFEKFRRRHQNHGSPVNLLPVHADAIAWWVHVLPSGEVVDRVWLLFPNPEPKNPAKRWLRMPFFAEVLAKLKRGGTIVLRTNVGSYAEEARLFALQTWKLDLVSEQRWNQGYSTRLPQTHFEKKYLQRGDWIYEQVWQKS